MKDCIKIFIGVFISIFLFSALSFAQGIRSSSGVSGGVTQIVKISRAHDFPSVAAGGASTNITALAGVETTHTCLMTHSHAVAPMLIFKCYISSSGNYAIRAENYTAGAIDPASITFSIYIFK